MTTNKEEKNEAAASASSEKGEVKVPKKFKGIVSEIEKMSVLDLSELVGILEDKFGVSASAPMMMAAPGGASQEDAQEESLTATVELTEVGGNKIGVIKALREITDLGLKDAKDLADGAPAIVKENVAKEEAAEMKKKIEEAGGKATLK